MVLLYYYLRIRNTFFKLIFSAIFIYCAITKCITKWSPRECNGVLLDDGMKPKCAPTLMLPFLSATFPENNMGKERCTRWRDPLANCTPPLINFHDTQYLM